MEPDVLMIRGLLVGAAVTADCYWPGSNRDGPLLCVVGVNGSRILTSCPRTHGRALVSIQLPSTCAVGGAPAIAARKRSATSLVVIGVYVDTDNAMVKTGADRSPSRITCGPKKLHGREDPKATAGVTWARVSVSHFQ